MEQLIYLFFRVDSPMKGEYSSADERLLSFIVVTMDVNQRLLTARECLWNTENKTSIQWGKFLHYHFLINSQI